MVKRDSRIDDWIAGWPLAAGWASLPRAGTALARALTMTGLIAAYVGLEWVSFIHEYKGVPITPWNPGLGFVLAVMVLFGTHYAAVLFVGAVVAEIVVLRSHLAWPVIVGIAAIIALGYGVVAQLIRGNLRLHTALNRLRDVVLLLMGGILGAVLVALLICLLLLADEDLDLNDVFVAAGPLLIGDVIGIAVVTPLTLRLALRPAAALDRTLLRIVPELGVLENVARAAHRAGRRGGRRRSAGRLPCQRRWNGCGAHAPQDTRPGGAADRRGRHLDVAR
jgi:hypothetical protein